MQLPNPRFLIFQLFLKERDRLILWAPVLIGIGISLYFLQETEPSTAIPARLMAGCMALLLILRSHFMARMVLVATILVAAGFFTASLRTQTVAAPVLQKTLYGRMVEGVVSDIHVREKGQRLILEQVSIEGVKSRTTPKYISLSFKEAVSGVRIGDHIRVKTVLFPPPAPVLPGAYDFARGFYFKQIGATGYSPKAPEILNSIHKDGWQSALTTLRLSIAERIAASMSPENAAVASAIMVGEQSAVSEEVGNAMRDAGIYHVLSISGLHMSLAAGLVFFTVRFLLSFVPVFALRVSIKKIAAVVGLSSAFAYLLLAGAPVPAIRSFIMVACVMVAVLVNRRGISLYSLAWAATIILLIQPESLLGASFQLSFAATLAIVALYENYAAKLYKPVGVLHNIGLYFVGLMITSLVATLATTPLTLYHFNRMAMWGIGANMLTMPLASFWIMPTAILAFLMMPFGLEHWPLIWLDKGIGVMIAGAKWVAGLPYAAFAVPSLTFSGVLLVTLGGLWLCLWKSRWRLVGIPLMMAGLLTIMQHQPYDMMISDDGTKVAVHTEKGDLLFLRGKPDSFDGEAWLKHEGHDQGITPKEAIDVDCDRFRCVYTIKAHKVVVVRRKDAVGVCQLGADIITSATLLRDEVCKKTPWLFDRWKLEKTGAVGLRFIEGKVEMESVSQMRGKRPWDPKPYYKLYPRNNPAITKEKQLEDNNE